MAAFIATPHAATAQAQSPDDQAGLRRQMDEWRAQFRRLVDGADVAWDKEMAREAAGDCVEATTTYDDVSCLVKELDTTKANYATYIGAFRDIFSLKMPGDAGETSGPSGTPPTREEMIARLDQTEATWLKYKDEFCGLAEDKNRGGTIAPSVGLRCEIQVIRGHMREVGRYLGDSFHR